MKQLLLALACIALVISIWGYFYVTSSHQTEAMSTMICEEIIPLIKDNKFQMAKTKLCKMEQELSHVEKHFSYFVDSEQLIDLRDTFDRTMEYVDAKDVSNSSGEIVSFRSKLKYITKQQMVTLSNIF